MTDRNKGKILVTGGTQGIGAATVHLLVKNNYEVHVTHIPSTLKDAEELCARYPGQVFAHQLDQGSPEEIINASFLNEHSWKGIVFNAALGSATVKKYIDKEEDLLETAGDEAMLKVNALGPLWIYKRVKDNLLASAEKTKLVFLASVGGGITAFPGFALSDGMSKAAVAFLVRQLAAENVHTLIDVFSICPGATETPMFTASTLVHMTPDERKAFDAAQSKKRLIQPEDIAYWIYQLLQDESTVLHGANIDASMGLGVRPGILTESKQSH